MHRQILLKATAGSLISGIFMEPDSKYITRDSAAPCENEDMRTREDDT